MRSTNQSGGRARWAIALLSMTVVVAAAALGAIVPSSPASAYPAATVTLEGHGYGHGHGMGQWGALGYALAGTGYQSIVAHYYGGTTLANLAPAQVTTTVRVALTENDGNGVIVTSGSPFTVAGLDVAAGQAVQMSPAGGGRWNVWVGSGCGGPWPATPTRSDVSDPTASPGANPGLGDPATATRALQLCQGGGNLTVRGSIEAVFNSAGAARTVNIVPLEQYVSGVVPNESPAGWGSLGQPGPQGQPWGFQELEAQAVAARSYVMAGLGSYGGYADTCDLDCQTYRGTLNESALTDLAVSDTAGKVMEFPSGAVAATQYSASTGGYTAPGTFPAVPDAGDSVCVPGACNPNHTWTASIPVSTIEATWPSLGTLVSVDITARDGDGDWGGRVTAMTLVGSDHDVSLTGDAFAVALGLKSDWFTTDASLGGPAVGMAATPRGAGYRLAGSNGAVAVFGDAGFLGAANGLPLAQPVVGTADTPDGKGYWLVAADGGLFSYGNATFYGSMGGTTLNRPVVGMAATPAGKGYWEVASDGGIFSFGNATFYGSMGGTTLNRPVVGMAATADGKGYWEVASDGGIFSFGDATFYGSMGGTTLNRPVVGMAATPDGKGYWEVASDGGIFSFGDATFHGSTGNIALAEPVVGMASADLGRGYWLVASDGGIFSFGDAAFLGSAAG
ncbi:MAG: SpoIID/LytB domain-containing protein [Acidimicrobiales bacterium]|jgi:SpoIID/LytB domain protein